MLTLGPLQFDVPAVMGVLNVTPDSFSDGGAFFDRDAAVDLAIHGDRYGKYVVFRAMVSRLCTAAQDLGLAILDCRLGGDRERPASRHADGPHRDGCERSAIARPQHDDRSPHSFYRRAIDLEPDGCEFLGAVGFLKARPRVERLDISC